MPITVSGTQITFNDGTNQTTAFTGGSGTVTSVATGNGLQGGTITTSGTLSIACPTFNTVGSYCPVVTSGVGTWAAGSNYSIGTGSNQIRCSARTDSNNFPTNQISGTWRWMAGTFSIGPCDSGCASIACRVS